MNDAPAIFARPGPRWFTIPAHRPFVDDLAAGLLTALSPGGPEALSDAIVLTPTRQGARPPAGGGEDDGVGEGLGPAGAEGGQQPGG